MSCKKDSLCEHVRHLREYSGTVFQIRLEVGPIPPEDSLDMVESERSQHRDLTTG